jgi:type II restriction enzyme
MLMNLDMNASLSEGYRSKCQIARCITEDWGERNLFCMACPSNRLSRTAANTSVFDFQCAKCAAKYQLKSSAKWSERSIPDSAYDTMIRAIGDDRAPHLLVLQYSPSWTVRNLLLIPFFFFNESVVKKRPPLSPTARRAGWVGCNIAVGEIAAEGKLRIVQDGEASSDSHVRAAFRHVAPIASIPPKARGWTLDVLRMVEELPNREFTIEEAYKFESRLRELYPENNNIRPKIRQQLQVLRDKGFLRFTAKGRYLAAH